jgi:rod shape-determining protein MreC
MINNSHDSQSKATLILHISRPVRIFLKRVVLVAFLAFAGMGVFISVDESHVSSQIREFLVDKMYPVIAAVSRPIKIVGESDDAMESYFFVREKNKKLIEENKALKRQLINLSSVSYENENLRKLLNFIKDSPYKFISTKVVGNTSGPFVRTVLVNAGSKQNVKKGQAVVNEEGLVGRVLEVGEESSRVLLITDINSNIPVISSKSRERSIMSGNNNEAPELAYLAKDSKMEAAEVLLTSGDGGIFPAGLQVGTSYLAGDGKFKVDPLVSWNHLDNLSIIDYSR